MCGKYGATVAGYFPLGFGSELAREAPHSPIGSSQGRGRGWPPLRPPLARDPSALNHLKIAKNGLFERLIQRTETALYRTHEGRLAVPRQALQHTSYNRPYMWPLRGSKFGAKTAKTREPALAKNADVRDGACRRRRRGWCLAPSAYKPRLKRCG